MWDLREGMQSKFVVLAYLEDGHSDHALKTQSQDKVDPLTVEERL